MTLKEKAEKLLAELKSGRYDNEGAHGEYEEILERFAMNYDESLLPIIQQLIVQEKVFWYA